MDCKVHCCVGGSNLRNDINILKKGVHIVSGTPGRIYDMIKKGYLNVDHLKLFVLDEADEMLS